jgi:hypothetical protein
VGVRQNVFAFAEGETEVFIVGGEEVSGVLKGCLKIFLH